MHINDKTLHDFGIDLRAALAPLQEKYGVTIKMGNISYTEERFTTKLTVTNGQTPDEAERNAFDTDVWRYAHLGLERGMFNRIFLTPDGQRMAVRGFNTRSPKYPIIALRISDGQRIRCAEKHITELTDEYYQAADAATLPEVALGALPEKAATPKEEGNAISTEDDTTPSKRPDVASDSGQVGVFEKQFWEKMAVRRGEDALRELYRQAKKVGPNDPCPCGSGKKYKKCCGR